MYKKSLPPDFKGKSFSLRRRRNTAEQTTNWSGTPHFLSPSRPPGSIHYSKSKMSPARGDGRAAAAPERSFPSLFIILISSLSLSVDGLDFPRLLFRRLSFHPISSNCWGWTMMEQSYSAEYLTKSPGGPRKTSTFQSAIDPPSPSQNTGLGRGGGILTEIFQPQRRLKSQGIRPRPHPTLVCCLDQPPRGSIMNRGERRFGEW